MNETQAMKDLIKRIFNRFGYTIIRTEGKHFPYIAEKSYEEGGHTFLFWITDLLAEYIYSGSWHGDPEYYAIKSLIERNKVKYVVEVGAHNGIYTLAIARLIEDDGTVLAYEPNPSDALALQGNLVLNSISNVRLMIKGVGSKKGLTLFDSDSLTVKPNSMSHVKISSEIVVPLVALDDEIDERVDLIKIDVEGFEAEVLKGCQRLLETRPCLVLEIHNPNLESFGTSFAEIANLAHLEDYEGVMYCNDKVHLDHLTPWRGIENTPIDRVVHLFLSPRHS